MTAAEAKRLAPLVATVIEKNPGCFEGEDLSLAYSLEGRLTDHAMAASTATMELSQDDVRVLVAAERCAKALTPRRKAAAEEPPPEPFPILPVAIGVGAGAFLLFVLLSGR